MDNLQGLINSRLNNLGENEVLDIGDLSEIEWKSLLQTYNNSEYQVLNSGIDKENTTKDENKYCMVLVKRSKEYA